MAFDCVRCYSERATRANLRLESEYELPDARVLSAETESSVIIIVIVSDKKKCRN